MIGKWWARTGNVSASASSPRLMLPKQTWEGPQFIAAEPVTPRVATAFRQDTAFKRDYYAVKSHFVPPAPLLDCVAAKEGKGMAAKSETALRGTAARRPASTCRPRCRPRGRGAPGTSRPTMGAMVRVHGCGHGVCMGAWTWCAWCMMVGADVPGGPRACVVPDVVPVCAARRGRRALPWAPWCVCMVRAWRVHGAWTWCAWCMMVGADVLGGPRTRCRPRCRLRVRGAPRTSRPSPRRANFERKSPCLHVSARSVLTGRRARTLRALRVDRPGGRAPGPLGRPAPRAGAPPLLSRFFE